MMESQRNILLVALVFVSFLLWQQWQIEHMPETAVQDTASTQVTENFIPQSTQAAEPVLDTPVVSTQGQRIEIISDVLRLTLDTQGGDILSAQLLAYDAQLHDHAEPYQLLDNTPEGLYIAQSGLIGLHGPDASPKGRPVYTAAQTQYSLAAGQDVLQVPLTLTTERGLKITKTITLKRGQYDVAVRYDVTNTTQEPVQVQMYGQLKQSTSRDIGESGSAFVPSAFRGAVYSTKDNHYKKLSFSDVQSNNLNKTSEGGWIGMMQHYFTTVWIPNQDENHQYYSRSIQNGNLALVGFKSPLAQIQPGQQDTITSTLWIGPKLQDEMAKVAPFLNLTVDYGWLWFISQPLHWLLALLQTFVLNWGVAIILLTFVVRSVLYPLTKAQYTSMAKMRLLQPKMMNLKERYGDDRQRMSQAMMELYKKEKVNPLGGCLPVLVQMPIFIALYWTLMESVELRHAPFMLWIHDLSIKDPFYVLPVLTGVSMYFIQKMSPTTITDPVQQKVMQMMPVLFTVFFLWCPAGLTLYWLVSNVLTIVQQLMIYRQLEKKGLHTRQA